MRIPLLLTLLATAAFGQATITRGGALKKRQYQTYGNLVFFVDPAGDDTNSCTEAASPCRTFNGVYAKLPRIIRHNVTVNVAAGNYTFDSRWDGAQWSSADTSGTSGPIVDFIGPPLVDATLTTGTPTGTITSLVTTHPPLPTITDSSQSWTTDELRGRFLIITSGAANKTMSVIVSNTATTITHTPWGSATVPSVGDTYSIQTPAAIITGTQVVSNHTGGQSLTGRLRYTQLEFNSTGNSLYLLNTGPSVMASLGAVRILSSGSFSSFFILGGAGYRTYSGNYLQPTIFVENSGSGQALNLATVDTTASVALNGYFRSGGLTAVSIDTPGGRVQWNRLVAESASTSTSGGAVVRLTGVSTPIGVGLSYNWTYVLCRPEYVGAGIYISGSTSMVAAGPVAFRNCGIGLLVGGIQPGFPVNTYPTQAPGFTTQSGSYSPTLYCDGTTTCVKVMSGGRYTNYFTPTFIGVTNEYDIDGTVYTHSFINSLTPKRVVGPNQSVVELE